MEAILASFPVALISLPDKNLSTEEFVSAHRPGALSITVGQSRWEKLKEEVTWSQSGTETVLGISLLSPLYTDRLRVRSRSQSKCIFPH